MAGEAPNVQFIDHEIAERPAKGFILFPVILTAVDHDASHGHRLVVVRSAGGFAIVKMRADRATVRINENFAAVVAVADFGTEWAIDSIGVDLTSGKTGNLNVPVMPRPIQKGIECDDGAGPRRGAGIEEQEIDSIGMGGEEAKVDAVVGERGAQWIRFARFRD